MELENLGWAEAIYIQKMGERWSIVRSFNNMILEAGTALGK